MVDEIIGEVDDVEIKYHFTFPKDDGDVEELIFDGADLSYKGPLVFPGMEEVTDVDLDNYLDPSVLEGMDEKIILFDEKYITSGDTSDDEEAVLEIDHGANMSYELDTMIAEETGLDIGFVDALIIVLNSTSGMNMSEAKAESFIKKELNNLGFSRCDDKLSIEEELELIEALSKNKN